MIHVHIQIIEIVAKSKRKNMTAGEASEALLQNDYAHFNSNSSYHDIHESDSYISVNSNYNDKYSTQHVHNSIISHPDSQEIDEFSASANMQ